RGGRMATPSPRVPGTEQRTKNRPIVSKCSMNLFLSAHGTFTGMECHPRCAVRRGFIDEKSQDSGRINFPLSALWCCTGEGEDLRHQGDGDADAWPIYVVTLIVLLPSFFVMCGY